MKIMYRHKGFFPEELTVIECENEDDIFAILNEGLKHRKTG